MLKALFYRLSIVLKYTKNPLQSMLVYSGIKNKTICKLKNNLGEFEYCKDNKPVFGALLDSLEKIDKIDKNRLDEFKNFVSQLNSEIIELDDVKFKNKHIEVLFEKLIENPYGLDNLNDRIVIDIGANIADTTLYFASNGAKEVYGFEPLPPIFDIGVENINLNTNLKDKIHFFNLAVSDNDGYLDLYYSGESSIVANTFDESEYSYKVKAVTLERIIEEYDIVPDVLKVDCEGCEYGIVKVSDLSMFKDIIIEYHAKITNIKEDCIINKLKNEGFKINKCPVFDLPIEEIGIIHAYKT